MAKKTTKAAPAKKTIRKAAAEAKASSKAEKSAKLKAKAAELEATPASAEDADEDSDEAMLASVGSSGASVSMSMSAGAGPIGTASESSSGVRSFRHHPEIENFYRFIYENDLRYEALAIIEEILQEKKARKGLQMKKSKAH